MLPGISKRDFEAIMSDGLKPLAFLAATLALPAAAQETYGYYYAALGPQDYVNSSGAPLGSFAGVLQQDRANYHRFGRRDPQDQGDALFADRQMRALIPQLFQAGPNGWWSAQVLRRPLQAPLDAEVLVFVCGFGGRITYLVVDHANGDGHRGC